MDWQGMLILVVPKLRGEFIILVFTSETTTWTLVLDPMCVSDLSFRLALP